MNTGKGILGDSMKHKKKKRLEKLCTRHIVLLLVINAALPLLSFGLASFLYTRLGVSSGNPKRLYFGLLLLFEMVALISNVVSFLWPIEQLESMIQE